MSPSRIACASLLFLGLAAGSSAELDGLRDFPIATATPPTYLDGRSVVELALYLSVFQ